MRIQKNCFFWQVWKTTGRNWVSRLAQAGFYNLDRHTKVILFQLGMGRLRSPQSNMHDANHLGCFSRTWAFELARGALTCGSPMFPMEAAAWSDAGDGVGWTLESGHRDSKRVPVSSGKVDQKPPPTRVWLVTCGSFRLG